MDEELEVREKEFFQTNAEGSWETYQEEEEESEEA